MESTNKLTNIQHTNGTMSGSKRITLNDDPDKLLNEWLGELENLIGVSTCSFIVFCYFLFRNFINCG